MVHQGIWQEATAIAHHQGNRSTVGRVFIAGVHTTQEERIKTLLQSQIATEGGTGLVLAPRNGIQIDYSFTKEEAKVSRQFFIESISFIVAGYDADGVGRAWFVFVPNEPEERFSRNTLAGGLLRIGQDEVIARVIHGWSAEVLKVPFVQAAMAGGVNVAEELNKASHIIEWGIMTLQDAVDFCVLMTRMTESVQRFSDGTYLTPGGITGVGGAIDIARITPEEGFRWILRKELVVKDD